MPCVNDWFFSLDWWLRSKPLETVEGRPTQTFRLVASATQFIHFLREKNSHGPLLYTNVLHRVEQSALQFLNRTAFCSCNATPGISSSRLKDTNSDKSCDSNGTHPDIFNWKLQNSIHGGTGVFMFFTHSFERNPSSFKLGLEPGFGRQLQKCRQPSGDPRSFWKHMKGTKFTKSFSTPTPLRVVLLKALQKRTGYNCNSSFVERGFLQRKDGDLKFMRGPNSNTAPGVSRH